MSDETAALTLADLEYELPDELIAQTPAEPRDASRLLVERRSTGALEDRIFSELPSLLRAATCWCATTRASSRRAASSTGRPAGASKCCSSAR